MLGVLKRIVIHGWPFLRFPFTTLRLLGFGGWGGARATAVHDRYFTGYKNGKYGALFTRIIVLMFEGHDRWQEEMRDFRLSCDASTKLGVSPPYRGRLYGHLMRQAACNQQCTRYQEAWMSVYLFTARDQQGSRPSDRAGGQMQFTLQPLVLLTDGLREPSGFRPIPAKIHRRKWRSDLILPLRIVDRLSHVKRGSIPSIKLFRGGNKHSDMPMASNGLVNLEYVVKEEPTLHRSLCGHKDSVSGLANPPT